MFFPDRVPLHRHQQKPRFGTRNSILAPCRDGDLEEIIAIIITDASPSTIHDSPINVCNGPEKSPFRFGCVLYFVHHHAISPCMFFSI
jgi:hypothetical protein